MKLGSPQADAEYDRQSNCEADKYFAPPNHHCQWCERPLTEDEGTGDDKGYCPQCHNEWEES